MKILPPLTVAAIALAWLLIDPNDEFVGWNDLYHARHSGVFAESLTLGDGLLDGRAVIGRLLQLLHACLFYIHGPLPPAYIGVAYRLFETMGIGFDHFVFMLPTAAIVAAAATLLFDAMRRLGFSTWLALATGCAVLASPLVAGTGRGLGTYWVAAIVLNQALLLCALSRFDGTRARWMVGAAASHVVLSDMLSPLLLGACAAGYVFAGIHCAFAQAHGKKTLFERVRHLCAAPVLGPPALLMVALASAFLVTTRLNTGGEVPLSPTLVFWTLTAQIDRGISFSPSADLVVLRMLHLWGDAWPIVAAGALIGIGRVLSGGRTDAATTSLAIQCVGFSLLFFLMADDHPSVLYFNQIYLVVPMAVMLAVAVEGMAAHHSMRRVLAPCIMVSAVALAAISAVAFIWRLPVAISAERLIVAETDGLAGDVIGIRRPNYGHRAAGFVVRESLLSVWQRDPGQAVRVFHVSAINEKGYEPFLAYAGLWQRGDWFWPLLGKTPMATLLQGLPNDSADSQSTCGQDSQLCIMERSLSSEERRWRPAGDLAFERCDVPHCAMVDFGDGDYHDLALVNAHGVVMYRIVVRGSLPPGLAAGRHEIDDLGALFSSRYSRIWDVLPMRPVPRLAAIAARRGY
jgi:hypothetical protein